MGLVVFGHSVGCRCLSSFKGVGNRFLLIMVIKKSIQEDSIQGYLSGGKRENIE